MHADAPSNMPPSWCILVCVCVRPAPVFRCGYVVRCMLESVKDDELRFYTSLLDKGQALVSSVVEAIIAEVSSFLGSKHGEFLPL